MKGIVFTELVTMVEQKFGMEVADYMLSDDELKSKGAFTAIGTYEHADMIILLRRLGDKTNISTAELLQEYGRYFLNILVQSYPGFFERTTGLFSFLESIDNHIHPEVLKLYPDAELPSFSSEIDGSKMQLNYQSTRNMADFAHGLIEGSAKHFNEPIAIRRHEEGDQVIFLIEKQ